MNRTWMARGIALALALLVWLALEGAVPTRAQEPRADMATLVARMEADAEPGWDAERKAFTPCQSGMADIYPCSNVDLMAYMPLASIGGSAVIKASSLWGWTDPQTAKEYALVGLMDGTAFVDITDASNPIYLGKLPSHTGTSSWRELKVYSNHAYIVSDSNGAHGIQIFDLTQLRNVPLPPTIFTETAHYGGSSVGSIHNMVINEQSGRGYAVGTSSGTTRCSGGLHALDLQNPTAPVFLGCYSADGYTHDAQCITYNGPDTAHVGKEICVASNEDTVTVVDMTNAASPVQLSRTSYAGVGYTHQSWFTADRRYMVVDDELDEMDNGHNGRTYIWNMTNLDAPVMIGTYTSNLPAIDHNQYIRDGLNFQANYRAGLRILNLNGIASANLTEVGYFDIYPANNNAEFNGAWNVYPFFPSKNVIVSGIEQGLFVLRPTVAVVSSVTVSTLDSPAGQTWPAVVASVLALGVLIGARRLRRC